MSAPESIGRYQILQSVGSGGMGSLYLARDPKIGNRRVVIKLLREGFDNPELRERFAREADAAGGLHHINVVTIFDVGDYDGQPFIAMEYIQGETLTDLIGRGAKLSISRKLQLMEELCAGLHYAHRAGVVHRDIKPANIMVDEDGVLKILDFGIARLGGSGMTQAGMVMGTLNYMAPEQMAGQPVDHRADIFSSGALFYELLSSRRAFPGELPGIVHKIMTATREPLASVAPDLDPGIVAIVDRCLAREPGDRYVDMATVRRELGAVRQRILLGEQKELHARMEEARGALGRSDFPAALQACDRILVLDSDYAPALELQQQARASLEAHQAEQWLTEARGNLERGALTAAAHLVDRALSIATGSPEARSMREAIDEARRRMAEAHEREAAFAVALARSQQQLDAGAPDLALASIDEALGIDSANPEAHALQERIRTAITARRKADQEARERAELEAHARAVVDAARQKFITGDHAAALSMLETFQPAHAMVGATLSELRAEAKEMDRRRVEAEQRLKAEQQRREEDERRQEQEHQRRAREDEERRKAVESADRRRLEDERQRADEKRRRDEVAHQLGDATIHIDARSAQAQALRGLPADRTVLLDPKALKPAPPIEQTIHVEARTASPDVRAPAVATTAPPSRRTMVLAGIAVLAIVAGIVAWRGLTSAPAVVPVTTSVVLNVAPWAKIDAITRKTDGRQLGSADLVTPVVITLPPGEYHVRASNPNYSPLEFDLTVTSGESQTVRYEMPGFDPQKEANGVTDK